MSATDPFKPLFNRRLLADAILGIDPRLDDEQRRIALSWSASAADGSLLGQKEKPLQGQFLSEVLGRLLGYHPLVGAEGIHHMEPETSSKAVKGYRPPDARLGWYGAGIDQTRGVLELKAPGTDLDAKQGANYGRLTPVEQAFGYAAKVDGCRWVMVSNFIELRLYRTDRGQGYCQRFELAALDDPEQLNAFLFLLSRHTLFGSGPDSESPVERLATHTHVEEDRISKAFYVFYPRLKQWIDYLDVLARIKVLDLACGSGAFLVAAFDYLIAEYERVNRAIAELQGAPDQLGLFDLDRQILQQNLFGVDLNAESVEITKLSLWLKTARRDKPLNNLDGNIRCGNSLVEPPPGLLPEASTAACVDPLARAFVALPADSRAFDWRAAFPDVFAAGGFDIVVGNPPYVRQEALGPLKPYLAQRYASYHGVADLYVYFYERGLELLAPDGKLSFIVTNKWLRAGYGEPLRRLFSERALFEEILDFGHAPIFEDADTFPCIIVARRQAAAEAEAESGSGSERGTPPLAEVRVCPVPRDRPAELALDNYVHEHAYPVPWGRYGAEPWSLEPPAVDALMQQIRERGVPLADFVGVKPMYGIKTGLNEAFLIDDATRAELIRQDTGCTDVIKPYLRGQDIKRWAPDWQGLWMIVLKSSGDFSWPWSNSGDAAEAVFAKTYPSLHAHMKTLEVRLRARQDQGRHWWELRSCDYYSVFERPKMVHTDIAWRPQFAFSDVPLYFVNTCYCWPSDDLFALAVINSPLMWAYMWRNAQHGKDEALRLFNSFTTTLPIAEPTAAVRREVEEGVAAALELTQSSRLATRELLTWLRLELAVDKPGQRLEAFADLSADALVAEVRKRRPKGSARLTPPAITELIDTHRHYAAAEQARAARLRGLERRLSALVIQSYQLSEAEIELLWRTAPPRMPRLGATG